MTDNGHGTFSGQRENPFAPLPDPPVRRRTLWRVQEIDNVNNNAFGSLVMKRILSKLWKDDCGALLATEWVVLATILVIGIIPGLVAIRKGLLNEMKDIANATMSLDQSYEFTGNELFCEDEDWDLDVKPMDTAGTRRHVGKGSLTEIVTKANNANVQTVLVSRKDGQAVRTDRREVEGHRNVIARTAGSAFIQGNHTKDGREMQS